MRTYAIFCMMMASCLTGLCQTLSPSVLPAAGASGTVGSVSLSWTLGETASLTFQSGSVVLTQGEQQPLPLSPLPLSWLSLNGDLNRQKQAVISWQVEEHNVAGFSIEKQTGSSSYVAIGYVPSLGDGAHTYHFTEQTTLNGEAFYRVKQIDVDGNYTNSRVLYLKNNGTGNVVAYPNPVVNKTGVYVTDATLINTPALLVDLQGSILQQLNVQPFTEIDLSAYPQGMYMVKLRNGVNIQLIKL